MHHPHHHHHYRDPPPYPGHHKQLSQPGYRQSYSGSETSTDISLSSTENLSTSLRQDPPGEETKAPSIGSTTPTPSIPSPLDLDIYNSDGTYSILAQLAANQHPPRSSVEVRAANSSTFYVTGSMAPNSVKETMVSNRQPLWSTQHLPSSNWMQRNAASSQSMQYQLVQSQSAQSPIVSVSQIAQSQIASVQSKLLAPNAIAQSFIESQQPESMPTQTQPAQSSPMQADTTHSWMYQGSRLKQPNTISNVSQPTSGIPKPKTTSQKIASIFKGKINQNRGGIPTKVNSPQSIPEEEVVTSVAQRPHVSPLAKMYQQSRQRQTPQQKPQSGLPKPQQLQHKYQQQKHQQLEKQQKELQQQQKDLEKQQQELQQQQLLNQQQELQQQQLINQQKELQQQQLINQQQELQQQQLINQQQELQQQQLIKQQQERQQQQQLMEKQHQQQQLLQQQIQQQYLLQQQKNQQQQLQQQQQPQLNVPLSPTFSQLPQELAPPPMYARVVPEGRRAELRRSFEMLERADQSLSHPDLTLPGEQGQVESLTDEKVSIPNQKKDDLDYAEIAVRASTMVEMMSSENKMLRGELEGYYRKVTKLQKFELEIQKAQESYDQLVQSSQKRENLEKAMRFKLEAETKKQQETIRDLEDQLSSALTKLSQPPAESFKEEEELMRTSLSEKDLTIERLEAQNIDLQSSKERLETELAAQRSTLQEQRTHIDVLDSALNAAKANVTRLEEEVKKSRGYSERIQQLQSVLESLQASTAMREGIEHALRNKLEENVLSLNTLNNNQESTEGCDTANNSDESQITRLKQMVEHLEQKVEQLESERAKWEDKYLEEVSLRQLAVDVASTPKDARIAELERTSEETNKLIAEACTDKLKNQEEVYQANRKLAALQAKVKTLQAQMCEKDAMIKVLQKHTLSRSTSVSSLFGSPVHTPSPSVTSQVTTATPPRPSSGPSSRPSSRIPALRGFGLHNKQGSSTSTKSAPGTIEEKQQNRKMSAPSTASMLHNLKLDVKEPVQQRLWQV